MATGPASMAVQPPSTGATSPPGGATPVEHALAFWPQVHLHTGQIMGFEVLSPDDTVAGPCRTLERCAAQVRRWEELGHRGLQIALAIPVGSLESDDLSAFLLQLLDTHQLDASQVQLELREHDLAVADEPVRRRLRALRGRGVSIAIGDFLGGSSSLSSLARLPLDCLKLDIALAHGVAANPSDALIARMSRDIARALKLRLVVKGIETEGQLRHFSALRCDGALGNLFSRPLSSEEATALLQSGRAFAQGHAPDTGTRHLLLLDDEPNILRSLQRVFRAQPWTAHAANTPDEAFELLARHPIGVVMSDQRMPLMRGTDFLARVKALYPETVRIVLSGYTELESITAAINEGAIYKFLTKPWNDQQLCQEIEQAFRQHEMASEGQRLQQRLRDSNKQLEMRLRRNEARLRREETALDVTHEALNGLPVPVLGIDTAGMIVLSNEIGDRMLGGGLSLVGRLVEEVLPCVLEGGVADRSQAVAIGGQAFQVHWRDLGPRSPGMGRILTLMPGAVA